MKNKSERVFIERFKAFIKEQSIFFYPDVMVALPEEHQYYATQPVLIIEVLSENTRKFDRIDKFIQYQKLDTLQYYLLVEPDKYLVILYKKAAERDWQSNTFTVITDIIELPTFNISIALKDIYQA